MRPLAPYPVLDFVDGPAVDDTDALSAWLAAHDGERRQLRLPVSMDNLGIAVENFAVGDISIEVDDTALGISLADRVRAKSEGQAHVRLWLEGYWTASTLNLRRVGDAVRDEIVHAGIEADKPENGS